MSAPLTPTLRKSPTGSKKTRSRPASRPATSRASASSPSVAQLESTIAELREQLNTEKNAKQTDLDALAATRAELKAAQDHLATLTAPPSAPEPEPDATPKRKKLIGWLPA